MNGGDEVVAGPPQPLEWKFSQVFGERTAGEEIQEVDIISAIEFDKTGDHLATGDRGGRVVLFERTDTKDVGGFRRDLERIDHTASRHPEFRYKTEFQSHEPEFDYLKSLEIEEKINKIRWCQTANGALFLLSTNDKTIKFWKVQEKKIKKISEMNVDPSKAVSNGTIASSSSSNSHRTCLANGGSPERSYNSLSNDFSFPSGGIPSLHLPVVVTSHETSLVARCRRVYAHAHDYHINSISNNSDGETFISADDLRINLWNLEISNQSFNIVDVKPANMEDLTEVITSAEFHPTHCNLLAYSSSKGCIRLIDLRQSALLDSHAKIFEELEQPGSKSFFTEIIASISDIKFGRNGRYILSRDYMTLKLWDINMDSGPVATFQVHEYLRPKLCDLYENDSIFDKFECCLSGDGLRVATGSYSNLFRVFGCVPGSTEATTLEASKNPMRRQVQTPSRPSRSLSSITRVVRRGLSFFLTFFLYFQRTMQSLLVVAAVVCCCCCCCFFMTMRFNIVLGDQNQEQNHPQLMPTEIRSIPPRSCCTSHGIRLKTLLPVLLQIACTCITHNDGAVTNTRGGFGLGCSWRRKAALPMRYSGDRIASRLQMPVRFVACGFEKS